jgi:glucan phosphoethanolaminetransferase (alkaline phosphatase superfamily)
MQTTSETIAQPAIEPAGPRGLGGLLLLPIFYLIIMTAFNGYNFAFIWDWEYVVDLATGQVDPDYQWLLWPTLWSVGMWLGLVAFAIYLLVILFQKKHKVRRLAVWFYSALLIVTVIDFGISAKHAEFTQMPEDIRAAGSNLYHAILVAPFWILYFLCSKRVKATFVN